MPHLTSVARGSRGQGTGHAGCRSIAVAVAALLLSSCNFPLQETGPAYDSTAALEVEAGH